MINKSVVFGVLGSLILLGFYFLILNFVSGWEFTLMQFKISWYYIIVLSLGFGTQIGLYTYLRQKISNQKTGKVVAVSGTASTIAMISCCSHYLVNILPIIGITGFLTIVGQYQTQLFWVGILANLFGIIYILRKIFLVKEVKIASNATKNE